MQKPVAAGEQRETASGCIAVVKPFTSVCQAHHSGQVYDRFALLISGYRCGLVRRVDFFDQRIGPYSRWALLDALKPDFQVREVVKVLTLPGVRHNPRINGHVSDAVLVSRYELAAFQLLVQHSVQARGFVDLTLYRVGDFFGGEATEVMVLSGHWAKAAHLPKQPLQGHLPATQVFRQETPGFFCEVEQDGA